MPSQARKVVQFAPAGVHSIGYFDWESASCQLARRGTAIDIQEVASAAAAHHHNGGKSCCITRSYFWSSH
jgi:hypothetical protein